VHEVGLEEPDLGLMRMHVNIDILRRKRQKHKHHRMTLFGEGMAICFGEGM
jgi:hypothetical protein